MAAPATTTWLGYEGLYSPIEDWGEDKISGGDGRDRMDGGFGGTRSLGDGSDTVPDGENRSGQTDIISAGGGNDVMVPDNKPAGKDIVHCGDGKDTVYADRADVLVDCEKVMFRGPTHEGSQEAFNRYVAAG